jgi:uncharacterized protein (TIGR02466 family)
VNEFHYFPSAVYREEIPDWTALGLDLCTKYFMQAGDTLPMCQTVGFNNDPRFSFLVDHVANRSIDILRGQGYAVDAHEAYVQMWAQSIGDGGGHVVHVHKNSQISGFFMLQAEEGSAYPIFEDPRPAKLMVEMDMANQSELSVGSSSVHFNNLIPGTLMLFNSWLPHRFVSTGNGKSCRFIHFVVNLKGK